MAFSGCTERTESGGEVRRRECDSRQNANSVIPAGQAGGIGRTSCPQELKPSLGYVKLHFQKGDEGDKWVKT